MLKTRLNNGDRILEVTCVKRGRLIYATPTRDLGAAAKPMDQLRKYEGRRMFFYKLDEPHFAARTGDGAKTVLEQRAEAK